MARSKKACLIFFDEIDAIGGARFDDGAGGDNEVSFMKLSTWHATYFHCYDNNNLSRRLFLFIKFNTR